MWLHSHKVQEEDGEEEMTEELKIPPTNSEGRKCKTCGSDRTIILRWPDTDSIDEHILACINCGAEETLEDEKK
jgi:DNA-directed RNA polymerase subunit M/transcription elongation factor TFIIS